MLWMNRTSCNMQYAIQCNMLHNSVCWQKIPALRSGQVQVNCLAGLKGTLFKFLVTNPSTHWPPLRHGLLIHTASSIKNNKSPFVHMHLAQETRSNIYLGILPKMVNEKDCFHNLCHWWKSLNYAIKLNSFVSVFNFTLT